jgi:hypothetical protein
MKTIPALVTGSIVLLVVLALVLVLVLLVPVLVLLASLGRTDTGTSTDTACEFGVIVEARRTEEERQRCTPHSSVKMSRHSAVEQHSLYLLLPQYTATTK